MNVLLNFIIIKKELIVFYKTPVDILEKEQSGWKTINSSLRNEFVFKLGFFLAV
jgi:hypothetical protein